MPEIGAVWYGDDIAYKGGLMVSPATLREYVFPWMAEMIRESKKRGLPFIYHSDGNLWQAMDDLINLGINALYPIELLAMDIRKVKQKYGHRLCLTGNIDIGYTLSLGRRLEVISETKQRFRDIGPEGGYCLRSSNSILDQIPLENYKMMLKAI